jgi:hypothetical protein
MSTFYTTSHVAEPCSPGRKRTELASAKWLTCLQRRVSFIYAKHDVHLLYNKGHVAESCNPGRKLTELASKKWLTCLQTRVSFIYAQHYVQTPSAPDTFLATSLGKHPSACQDLQLGQLTFPLRICNGRLPTDDFPAENLQRATSYRRLPPLRICNGRLPNRRLPRFSPAEEVARGNSRRP